MSGEGLGYQAVNVKAPQKRSFNSDASPNTLTTVRLFTVTAVSQSHAMPEGWPGKFVRITAETADLTYYFADTSGQLVDNTVTGSADGSSSDGTKLGGTILAGQSRDVRLPHTLQLTGPAAGDGKIYFVRQGSASGNARIELSSD
jgi:hypothetical protein